MAISYISSASAAANTVSMPSHTTGDVIIVFAYRDGNATGPTVPAGWYTLNTSGANTNSAVLAWKYAASGSETTGTWTNATGIAVAVYRGVLGIHNMAVNGASSNSLSYPALTLAHTDSTSWAVRAGGHRTATNMTTNTPSGYTQRTGVTTEVQLSDSNGNLASSPTSATQSVNQTSGYRTYTVELIGANPAASALTDDYNDNSINTSKWTNWGGANVTETGGQLVVTGGTASGNYYGMDSANRYDFTGSYMYHQLVSPGTNYPNRTVQVANVQLDLNNFYYWEYNNGVIYAYKNINNSYTQVGTSLTYPGNNYYWQIRESGGTIYFEYSTDATSWTTHASDTLPFISKNVLLSGHTVGNTGAVATASGATFDNFNTGGGGGGPVVNKGAFFALM